MPLNSDTYIVAGIYKTICEDTNDDDVLAGMEEADKFIDFYNANIQLYTDDGGFGEIKGGELIKLAEDGVQEGMASTLIEYLIGEEDMELSEFCKRILNGELLEGLLYDHYRGAYNAMVLYCIDKQKIEQRLKEIYDQEEAEQGIEEIHDHEEDSEDEDVLAGMDEADKLLDKKIYYFNYKDGFGVCKVKDIKFEPESYDDYVAFITSDDLGDVFHDGNYHPDDFYYSSDKEKLWKFIGKQFDLDEYFERRRLEREEAAREQDPERD